MIRKPLFGMALGGGGVRGFAHIGVLRVLVSEGINIDCIAGTSMGGIVGALFASGLSPNRIEEEAKDIEKLGKRARLIDTLITNLDFIFKGENIRKYFRGLLGGSMSFEDVKIPLALTAVDFNEAKEVALQSGDLIEAINATMALPGVVEPVKTGNKLLMDGGSLNNVPADLVRSMGAEVVMAVDVSPDVTDKVFWEKQRLPGIAALNWRMNAIMVANITAAKLHRARANVIIRPIIKTKASTLSGFKYTKEIITAGENAALEVLPELHRLLKPQFFFKHPHLSLAKPMQLR